MLLFDVVAGELLGKLDEFLQIGVVGRPVDNQVKMIRHVAADENCECRSAAGSQDLQRAAIDDRRIGEVRAA